MENKKKPRIVYLAVPGRATNIIYNSLREDFEIMAVIFESPVSKRKLLKRRISKLGIWTVLGQLLFQIFVSKILSIISSERIREILIENKLSDKEINPDLVTYVPSVNDKVCSEILSKISPDLVIVNGTRIIAEKTLNSISGKFINMHAGITPNYRGVHGAYWALVNKDSENCGVTIHLVDKGIDTGGIISKAIIKPTYKDNFSTYHYLQLALGIPLLKEIILGFPESLKPQLNNSIVSKLYYHPTIGQYLLEWIFKKVK